MKTRISIIILTLAAIALIAVAFFVIIPDHVITDSIRWLDFAVMTVITAIYALNVLFPFIDESDRSHKEVASLGIRWTATGWYGALAFLFMVGNIIYDWQYGHACGFSVQATVQGALFLFFLMGIVSSRAAMRKAQDVYIAEKRTLKGKTEVKVSLAHLLSAAEARRDLSPETARRIRQAVAEGRYITPSLSEEAKDTDNAIMFDCDALATALIDFENNQTIIEDRLHRLETDIRRRKRL